MHRMQGLVAVLYFNSCLPTCTDTLQFLRTLHHRSNAPVQGCPTSSPSLPTEEPSTCEQGTLSHMDAVLPWQSLPLDRCYQEPNCSFGGHALTVSLWKRTLAPNRIVGYVRNPMGAPGVSSTRVSSGSKKSIALYRKDVNMVVLWHDDPETAIGHHDTFRRAGQGSHSPYQGFVRLSLRCGGNQTCFAANSQARDCPCSPLPQGTPASSPCMNARASAGGRW